LKIFKHGFEIIVYKQQWYLKSYNDLTMIFSYIKADQFFPKYCPEIKSYKHKIRGLNGRGNPVYFSADEQKQIRKGLKMLLKDLIANK